MPKPNPALNLAALTVAEVARFLDVTPRQVRNWAIDKGLPTTDAPGGRLLDWPTTLAWYVEFKAAARGNGGNPKPSPGQNLPEAPEEDYKDALARKTRAEADLIELKLARERGLVAAIGDVERVLNSANTSLRTLIASFPAQLAPQLVSIDDRTEIFALMQRECNQLLTNMANIDTILKAGEDARAARRERDS